MRKAASRCKQAMAHLLSTSSSRVLGMSPHMHRPLSSGRPVAAAAAAGQPQPPPGHRQPDPRRSQQPPPAQVSQQQQQQLGQHAQHAHRGEYESIKRQWHVKRTQLAHYPEAVQQRILSSRGSASKARAASSSSSSSGGGSVVGSHRGPQAALAAALEKLAEVLAYERQTGFTNVIGRVERIPASEFAVRRLLDAASQLAAGPAAAHTCVQAAQRMRHYAGLPPPERQAAVEAAEAAVQQALLALQVGGRAPQARAARYQLAVQQALQVAPQQVQMPPPPQQQQQPVQQQRAAGAAGRRPSAQPAAAAAAPDVLTTAATAAAAGSPPLRAPTAAAGVAQHSELSDPEFDAAAEEAHAEESGAAVPTPEGEEYVMRGNRRVKAATEAFRRSFAEAAAAALAAQQRGGGGGGSDVAAAEGGEQRSAEWFKLRERRLTASAFSKALGLFSGDRHQLWEEKVGLVQPFAGNAATEWGTSAEPRALETYQAVTGQRIASCMFQVKHDDPVHGWLGASPDGLIESLTLEAGPPLTSSSWGPLPAAAAAGSAGAAPWDAPPAAAGSGGAASPWVAAAGAASLPPHVAAAVAAGHGPLTGPGPGILEIKCPHNKGQPQLAVPPQHATWYYMPQVQGLMDIFNCEWANLYIWTSERGSAVYHIRRDRAYWSRLWGVLADFWWNHVVPARQEFQAGRWEEVEAYRPPLTIPETEELRAWSKRMALAAPATFFKPQPLKMRS